MAEGAPQRCKVKRVVYAEHFYYSLIQVLTFGLEEFGSVVAYNFNIEIERKTQML